MEHHIVKCAHIEISIDGRDQPALQLGFPCVRRTMSACARDTADKLIGKALPNCIEHSAFAAEAMIEGSFGDTGAFGKVHKSGRASCRKRWCRSAKRTVGG